MKKTSLYLTFLIFISCQTTQKVRTGEAAFELKQYALAIEMLKQEINKEYSSSKHFLLAKSYSEIDRVDEAIKVYKDAIDADTPLQHLMEYARLLKRAELYNDAIEVFNLLKTEAELDFFLDKEIADCQRGLEWNASPDSNTVIERLPLNSKASDYSPSLVDGRLLFTSDRIIDLEADIYNWTGAAYSDIWSGSISGTEESLWNEGLNTKNNEGTPVLSPDASALYFTRCYSQSKEDGFCHIMVSVRERDGWSNAVPVPELVGNFNVMHPALSQDGRLLFFSSDASGGLGGMDLYFCTQTAEGWSQPQNLGARVNGEGDDVFPHIFRDTLYFASNSHPGMGGLDLFRTYFNSESQWVVPENLKTPINSGADDFGICIDSLHPTQDVKLRGYFSSSRPSGKGRDDIYAFVNYRPKPTKEKDISLPLVLSVKVVRPIYRKNNAPNSGIRRLVPVENAKVVINGEILFADFNGLVSQNIDSSEVYNIRATAEDLLSATAVFNSTTDLKDGAGYVRVILNPIFYDQEIVLKNIYYDFDSWVIRDDAKPPLDSLAKMLKDNLQIKIQLSSHTDCRGEEEFNLELSQKRATAAIDYLISSGIEETRLSPKGYGELKPFVDCQCDDCSEEDHQYNRRTSFVILSQ